MFAFAFHLTVCFLTPQGQRLCIERNELLDRAGVALSDHPSGSLGTEKVPTDWNKAL